MIKNISNITLFSISFFSLLVLEIFCAKLAFETLGEIDSGAYFLLVALNVIPLVLLVLKKTQFAMGLILLIGLLIIPYQLYLGHKLISLKEEAANITAYVYETKFSSPAFPKDLSGYTFSFPKLQKHFNYILQSDGTFHLNYYVGTPATSHFYHSDTKKWDYYPD